jgi:hypothetical protein
MIRAIWTLALVLSLNDPHIRSPYPELLDAVSLGARTSPTLRDLVDRIEASDVVVYLANDSAPSPFVAAHLSFISAAGGRRYLMVTVNRQYMGCQLMALLGHELQHAAEIADEPSVVDERSMSAHYRRIGFRTGSQAEQYDSAAAIETGRRIMRDVTSAPIADAVSRAPRPRR